MDDLHRFLPARVLAGHHQPGIGQVLHQFPVSPTQLLSGGQTAGILCSLAGPHHLDKDAPGLLLFGLIQPVEHLVGIAGHSALHPTNGFVGFVG